MLTKRPSQRSQFSLLRALYAATTYTPDSPMNEPSMQPLLALETDLLAALATAQSAHDATLANLDASRRTIDRLLRNEAHETALYVDDTQLQMQALRDVVQLEMDRARRDVAAFVEDATRNVTLARATRDRTQLEMRQKIDALHLQRHERARAWRDEIERVKLAAAQEAAQLLDETAVATAATADRSLDADGRAPVHQRAWLPTALSEGRDVVDVESVWVLPLLVSLVIGACLSVAWSTVRARRRAVERHQRVLYSEQLKSHFANGDGSSGGDEDLKPSSKKTKATSARVSVADRARCPTLQRRLRPGWSPAASTASTVSPPDTPTSSFSSHAASF